MSGDEPSSQTGPSRRDVLATGALATAGVVGSSHRGSASGTGTGAGRSRSTTVRGAMFPYQYAPDSRVTIAETGLEWRPRGLDPSYRTHVLAYDRARSFRALFFADADPPRNAESVPLEPARRSPGTSPDGELIGVELAFEG